MIQYVVSGTLNSVKINLSVHAGCQTVEHRHRFDMKSNISDIYRLTSVVASQPTYRPTPTYCICNKLLTAQLIYQSGSNRHWRFFSHVTLQSTPWSDRSIKRYINNLINLKLWCSSETDFQTALLMITLWAVVLWLQVTTWLFSLEIVG